MVECAAALTPAAPAGAWLALPPRTAHLHVLRTAAFDGVDDAALLRRFGPLLAPAERQRHDRYRFAASRREHLLTRALVRNTLSRYAAVAPADWCFDANAAGRPTVAAPALAEPLHFNLSNAPGCIVCLVARSAGIGVDVEDLSRRLALHAVAARHFAKAEAQALLALPETSQTHRFFAYWTLKEAYIKARGLGLAIALDAFSFSFDGPSIEIAFAPPLDDTPADWQFVLQALSDRHLCALAVRTGPRGGWTFESHDAALLPHPQL